MKTSASQTIRKSEDEFTSLYNWSERATVNFLIKRNTGRNRIATCLIDLVCMASALIAMMGSI